MKQKLLNQLNRRMVWLGYRLGTASNPFQNVCYLAVRDINGNTKLVTIDARDDRYDLIAYNIHHAFENNPDAPTLEIGFTPDPAEEVATDAGS